MRRLTIDRAGSSLRRCEQMRWSVLASLLLVGVIACGSADAPEPEPIDSPTERLEPISDRDPDPRADLLESRLSRDG